MAIYLAAGRRSTFGSFLRMAFDRKDGNQLQRWQLNIDDAVDVHQQLLMMVSDTLEEAAFDGQQQKFGVVAVAVTVARERATLTLMRKMAMSLLLLLLKFLDAAVVDDTDHCLTNVALMRTLIALAAADEDSLGFRGTNSELVAFAVAADQALMIDA